MLEKKRRVRRPVFSHILKKGESFSTPRLTLRIVKKDKGGNSFSFVVSRKSVKNAVERNRLRRRGYHAVRELSASLMGAYSGIFFTKKDAGTLSYRELKEEIRILLKRAGVFKRHNAAV